MTEKRPRGRPPATGQCVAWTEPMVNSLLRLRFETFAEELSAPRGTKLLQQVWSTLAQELSRQHEVVVSVDQCRNKLKALRNKWLAYHAGALKSEPMCLALMNIYWEDEKDQGTQNERSHARPEASSQKPTKRPRTTSTSLPTLIAPAPMAGCSGVASSGVDSVQSLDTTKMEDGLVDIASAVSNARPDLTGAATSTNFSSIEKLINARFNDVLERQDKQLQLIQEQNQLLALLVAKLKGGNPDRQDSLD